MSKKEVEVTSIDEYRIAKYYDKSTSHMNYCDGSSLMWVCPLCGYQNRDDDAWEYDFTQQECMNIRVWCEGCEEDLEMTICGEYEYHCNSMSFNIDE